MAKCSARLAQGTVRARRILGSAQGGADVHERLIDFTRLIAIHQNLRPCAHGLHQHCVVCAPWQEEYAREHAHQIAVDRGVFRGEGNRCNGGGGVRADAGQFPEFWFTGGDRPTQLADNHSRGVVQIARTPVVAEPGPGFAHRAFVCSGQGCNRGELVQKVGESWDCGLYLGLLKHDLGNPDGIGVARSSPGQVAGVLAVERKQRALQRGHGLQRFHKVIPR